MKKKFKSSVNASNANAGNTDNIDASNAGSVAGNANASNTDAGNVGQGAGHTINGGGVQDVLVKGKVKDLTTASDQYLQNLLVGAQQLGETAEVARIQAEIDRRNAAKGVTT